MLKALLRVNDVSPGLDRARRRTRCNLGRHAPRAGEDLPKGGLARQVAAQSVVRRRGLPAAEGQAPRVRRRALRALGAPAQDPARRARVVLI